MIHSISNISHWDQLYFRCCWFSISSNILHVKSNKLFSKSYFFSLNENCSWIVHSCLTGCSLQDGGRHKHEWDVLQVPCRLHHCLYPKATRPDDRPGHREGVFSLQKACLQSQYKKKKSLTDEMSRSVRSAWWTWREVSGLTPRVRRELGLRWQIYWWPLTWLFLCALRFVSKA